jgi:NADPH-dependent ferric siderophore reductase
MATNRRAQRHADHPPREHATYVIVADETSLTEVEIALIGLPYCATGRVFIEVADAAQIVPLDAPARMVVTWLPRARRSGAPGTAAACAPGEAALRAVRAWASEMLCPVDGDDPFRTEALLLGDYRTVAPAYEFLVAEADVPRSHVSADAAYRLDAGQY